MRGLSNRLLALLFFALVATMASSCAQKVELRGTDLQREPAPDFHLKDQTGAQHSLVDWRGKVVVLTFLYTQCPDECPLIAERLRAASRQMGGTMARVAFVAVSVDPQNDTPDSIRSFLQTHQLTANLVYLVGSPVELKPVWDSYYLGVQTDPTHPGVVAHTTRVVVIDKDGKQRSNLGGDFQIEELVYDIQALLSE